MTPTEIRYSDDDRGAFTVALAWRLPERITPELIAAAKRFLPATEDALKPAPRQKAKDWLAMLGTLCAGQMTAADAKAKIGVYVPLMEAPELVLTRETLREAGERFKWFPSFAEISAFMDEKVGPIKQLRARLEALANAKPTLPPPSKGKAWSELTDEEKAAHNAAMDAFRAKCAEPGPKPLAQAISVPPALKEKVLPRSDDAKALIAQGVSAGATERETAA
jgi:hypothetical protein